MTHEGPFCDTRSRTIKEVMSGEISEKTQEDIDEPTIPPSPMIPQGDG